MLDRLVDLRDQVRLLGVERLATAWIRLDPRRHGRPSGAEGHRQVPGRRLAHPVGAQRSRERRQLGADQRLPGDGLGDPFVIPVIGLIDTAVQIGEHVRPAVVPQQLPAPVGAARLAPVLAGHIVDEESLQLPLASHREAARQGIGERPVHVGLGAEQLPLATGERHSRVELGRRFVGDEVHGSGCGVAPVQRALWALQHLDPLEVHHLEAELRVVYEVDLVEVYAHRLGAVGREVVQAYAAQREDRRRVADRVLGGKVRGHRRKLQRLHEPRVTQFPAAEGVDGDWHFLQILFALLCSHDDLGERLLTVTGSRGPERSDHG